MVEVFKTNVNREVDANRLIKQIHQHFMHYRVNFDLEDCDRIMRAECRDSLVSAVSLIAILKENGFEAMVLPDDGYKAMALDRRHYWQL
jgi:hypothetical protein